MSRQIISNKTKSLYISTSLILMFLVYQSLTMGLANLRFYLTNQYTNTWQKDVDVLAIEHIEIALAAIGKANELHANNSHYLITQGLVNEWAATSRLFSDNEQFKYLQEAKHNYVIATQLRPTWPVTWATLAIVKWRLNEIDQQLIDYLNNANIYGPNRLEVHRAWLEVGFYLYQSKSVYTSQIVHGLREHLEALLTQQQKGFVSTAVTIIKRHKVERLACRWASNIKSPLPRSFVSICK